MIKHIILFLLASPILMASDLTPEVQKVTLKENYKPHIGILSGLTEPEGELDASGSVMIETALQPVIPFSAGLQFMLSEMDGETESRWNVLDYWHQPAIILEETLQSSDTVI